MVEVKRPAAPRPTSQGGAGVGQSQLSQQQQQQQPAELEWVVRREVLHSVVHEAPWGLADSSSGGSAVLAVVGGASAVGNYMQPEGGLRDTDRGWEKRSCTLVLNLNFRAQRDPACI